MPTRFIQRKPRPLLSVVNANTTGIGVDSDNDELKWVGASGVILVAPPEIALSFLIKATEVDSHCFVADANYQVVGVRSVISTTAAGATVDIKKCTGTTAPASGTTVLTAAVALDSTANTSITATLSATVANLQLAAGDRLALDYSGTLTGVVGALTIFLKRIE